MGCSSRLPPTPVAQYSVVSSCPDGAGSSRAVELQSNCLTKNDLGHELLHHRLHALDCGERDLAREDGQGGRAAVLLGGWRRAASYHASSRAFGWLCCSAIDNARGSGAPLSAAASWSTESRIAFIELANCTPSPVRAALSARPGVCLALATASSPRRRSAREGMRFVAVILLRSRARCMEGNWRAGVRDLALQEVLKLLGAAHWAAGGKELRVALG